MEIKIIQIILVKLRRTVKPALYLAVKKLLQDQETHCSEATPTLVATCLAVRRIYRSNQACLDRRIIPTLQVYLVSKTPKQPVAPLFLELQILNKQPVQAYSAAVSIKTIRASSKPVCSAILSRLPEACSAVRRNNSKTRLIQVRRLYSLVLVIKMDSSNKQASSLEVQASKLPWQEMPTMSQHQLQRVVLLVMPPMIT